MGALYVAVGYVMIRYGIFVNLPAGSCTATGIFCHLADVGRLMLPEYSSKIMKYLFRKLPDYSSLPFYLFLQ